MAAISNSKITNLVLAGSCACVADAATFPVDTVKVRMQTAGSSAQPSGIVTTVRTMAASGGARSFYSGLAAGLQRQFAFASIRIGSYEPVKQAYITKLGISLDSSNAAMLAVRLMAGVTTGAMAVCIAQPTEVVKVRMQSCSGRYSGCMSAYPAIFRAEGVSGLWRGLGPNVTRNAIVNCAEVVSYDTVKTYLMTCWHLPDTMGTHFASGLASGFIATVIASPVDVVKTRMMSASAGQPTSLLAVTSGLFASSGLKGFYKGFLPSFVRIAGWNILMFVMYERAKVAVAKLTPAADGIKLQLKQGKQVL